MKAKITKRKGNIRMKQVCNRTKAFLLALLILVTSTGLCRPILALEQDDVVEVDESTDFAEALKAVPDGGTIRISGTCTLPKTFSWKRQNKTITITGETPESKLDASAVSTLTFRDNVTFENMTLAFSSGGTVYANGNKLVIKESVTVENVVTLYGGGNSSSSLSKTDITIMSGTYARIYGGSNGGTVSGDVHTYIGGSVNSTIDHTNHSGTNNVFGGSKGGTVKGSTYLTFADNAKANYLYGGSSDSGSINGSIHLNVTGGKMMSIYGGGSNSNAGLNSETGCDIYATITNCDYVEQIFGGSENANHKGNVTLRILGGTITRRIYGGCYNNYSTSSGWSTSRCVDGDITLVIGSGANISFSSSESDKAIYAKSRQKSDIDTGSCKLIFADSAANTKYKNKTGAQDFAMKLIMSGKAAADSTHTLKHEKTSDTVITESCTSHTDCGLTVAATLALDPAQSLEYTGSEITPAVLTYTGTWLGEDPQITYSNNVNIGEASVTASYTRYAVDLTKTFNITKKTAAAPVSLTPVNETVQGKADGKILGLTTKMEYSIDGESFTPVTDPNMRLAPGTYYVRVAETEIQSASKTVTVTIKTTKQIINIDLLNVKYQLPLDASLQSESISPRLIASIDTLLYSKVGFEISKQSEDGEWSEFEALETNVAFISILGTVDGTDVTYTPDEVYGGGASYFFLQNTSAIAVEDFDTVLRIRAYVVTQDGYTLYGNAADFRLSAVLS